MAKIMLLENKKIEYSKYAEMIDEINQIYVDMISHKKSEVVRKNAVVTPVLNWYFDIYIQLIIHRCSELIANSTINYETNCLSTSFLLMRAAMENIAVLYDLVTKIEYYIKNEEIENIRDLLLNRVFGARGLSDDITIANFMTAIDKVEKYYPDFRKMYERISNFCHPGYYSAYNLFVKNDNNFALLSFDSKYGNNESNFIFYLALLHTSLVVLRESITKINDVLPKLTEFNLTEFVKMALVKLGYIK